MVTGQKKKMFQSLNYPQLPEVHATMLEIEFSHLVSLPEFPRISEGHHLDVDECQLLVIVIQAEYSAWAKYIFY